MSDRDAVVRSDWEQLINSALPNGTSADAKQTVGELLESEGKRLKQFYDRPVRAPPDSARRSCRPKQRRQIESCARAVLTLLFVQQRISEYRAAASRDANAVRLHRNGESNERGERVYEWLTSGMATAAHEEGYLNETLENAQSELYGYDNELDGINSVGPSNGGMSANNAINCLRDFDGRTEPFIRGILTSVDRGDMVLDIGTGTGVLAIVAAVGGAATVAAVELNPVTAILAGNIVTDLVEHGLLDEDTIDIYWGDAMRFGSESYTQYVTPFDTIISENISTGLFFEPQTQLIQHAYDAGLAAEDDTTMVPRGVSNYATIVKTTNDTIPERAAETVYQLQNRGHDVAATATEPVQYADIDHERRPQPSGVAATVHQTPKTPLSADAIRIHSIIDLGCGGYIGQQENTFLNRDLLLYLEDSLELRDESAETTIAYTFGGQTSDAVIALQQGETKRHHAIGEEQHRANQTALLDRYPDTDIPPRTTTRYLYDG